MRHQSLIVGAVLALAALAVPAQVNGIVQDMLVWDSDAAGPEPPILVVGGAFTHAGGVSAHYVAGWDGQAWRPFGSGLPWFVHALAIFDGDLVAAWRIPPESGFPIGRVSRWDGTSWTPLGSGMNDWIYRLVVHQGSLIAGGSFTVADGVPAPGVARWNGASWEPLGSGLPLGGINLASAGGELLAGSPLCRWNGSLWQPLGYLPQVWAITTHEGSLIAGGMFGAPLNRIARWTGSAWEPIGAGFGVQGVHAMATFQGELVAGGTFETTSTGVPMKHVSRWNGSEWRSLGAGFENEWGSFMYTVTVMSLQILDGALVAAGYLTGSGDLTLGRIGQWDGTAWRQLGPHLAISQPGGPGTGLLITNSGLALGHTYLNVASTEIHPSPWSSDPPWYVLGEGPFAGLFASNPSLLVQQVLLPEGTVPFHFTATSTSAQFGPYALGGGLLPALAFEAVCFEVSGGTVRSSSPVIQFVVE